MLERPLKKILTRFTSRPSAIALLGFTGGLTTIHASIVQTTATLPPPTGMYTLSPTCLIVACVGDIRVSGFQNTSDQIIGGNEVVSSNAGLDANVFQNVAGN